MATLKDLYARHDQEMKDLMEDQWVSWNALNERYGKGNIPSDVYQQWDQQYGNVRLHGLRAQQEAELEAYPLDPREYAYQQENKKQEKSAPDIFEQLKQKQQGTPDKMPISPDTEQVDVFAQLRRKQQELDQNGMGPGDDR